MIHIDRDPNPPALTVFSKPTVRTPGGKVTRAASELAKAIEFFTDATNYSNNTKLTKKTFDFKVYKDPELAKALEAVFGSKCAYCESRFAHVTPKDIEHYRPKSEIANTSGAPIAPGYFWLAGEWQNLLVSCPDCNRSREHHVPGQTKRVKLGKHTQFPLRDETVRVRVHTVAIAIEEPVRLLLDPCTDEPEKDLTFDENGLVYPRLDAAGQPSERGKVSIDVYALQRKGLVEERLRIINDIVFKLEQLRDLVQDLGDLMDAGSPQQQLDAKREQIRKLTVHLAKSTAKDAPYLAMIRDYIRRSKAAGKFDDLIQNGIDPESLLA